MDGSHANPQGGQPIRLDEVRTTGAYVCHWNGDLLRVTDGPVGGEASAPEVPASDEERLVTRISEDPFIPLPRARMIAANFDLEISC